MPLLAWICRYIVISFLIIVCSDIYRRYRNYRYQVQTPMITLELTPPVLPNKSPQATEHFFSILHAISLNNSKRRNLLGQACGFSLEIVSSRTQGIRYIIRVAASEQAIIQQQIVAYLPTVRFQIVEDYIAQINRGGQSLHVVELKQARHFAYPLANHEPLAQHDPISYVTGAMTKLASNEVVAIQLVLSPSLSRRLHAVRNRLLSGKHPEPSRKLTYFTVRLVWLLLRLIVGALGILLGLITELTKPSHSPHTSKQHAYSTSAKSIGSVNAVTESLQIKLSQPLFRANIRCLVVSNDRDKARQSIRGLGAAFSSYSRLGYQGLTTRGNFPNLLVARYQWYAYRNRLLSLLVNHDCLLSVSEIASLYHFQSSETAKTESLVTSLSRTLPATIAIKSHADRDDFDVILGENEHAGSTTAIGLTAAERERHVYVIGGTGNGKTTLLEYGIVQDMWSGKGVCVIDPHGDSALRLLHYIPQHRIKDVIYLNPRDLDFPIGLNLLELPCNISGSELAHEKDLKAEAVISVLRKIFDNETDGNAYRIERMLRNAIHTAFSVEDATLFTVLQLLTDSSYRKQIVKTLQDESLKRFWREEFGKAGDMQRAKMSGGPITRIERFERSETARRMLGQAKSTINFEEILNSSKIVICNFSKGRLGEDTSNLFGAAVLSQLQLAAWRRDTISEDKRVPFYLYVDEFQNFASESFLGLFSEARKYKLFLTIAQQSASQLQAQSMLNTLLDNVGTIICFRSKSFITEQMLLHQLRPYIDSGEIGNLARYHFYTKIAAVQAQEPMSGKTLLLEDPESEEFVQKVIMASRKQYAHKYGAISLHRKLINHDGNSQPILNQQPAGYDNRSDVA